MHTKLSLPLLLLVGGCVAAHQGHETHLLVADDKIHIEYTCRTPDGAVVAATGATDTLAGQTLSPIFVPRKETTPMVHTVPTQAGEVAMDHDMPMEEKIERYLLRQAPGKPVAETLELAVEGEVYNTTGGDRYLPMRRNFKKNRKITMSKSAFERAFETPPTVGLEKDTKVTDLSVKVLKVDGDKVEILYSVRPGMKLPSIFGEQVYTQTEDKFEVHTNVQDGALLRTSKTLIGKITEVTDDTFVVDYGHPFGFAPLSCRTVFNAAEAPPKKGQEQAAVSGK